MASLIPIRKVLRSTVGRKFLMGLSGLVLTAFMVSHLLGNLLLYNPDPSPFNRYAHAMMSWGGLLWVAEAGLAAVFLVHIVTAIRVGLGNRGARPLRYEVHRPKKGSHPTNRASRLMLLTGLVLMVFLPVHVKTFRFGPGMEAGYVAYEAGAQIRDLYGLVQEVFQDPLWVALYGGVMLLLWVHLRHGFWSAFQSLGAAHPRYSRLIWAVAFVFASVLAAGFFAIPFWFYFDVPGRLL